MGLLSLAIVAAVECSGLVTAASVKLFLHHRMDPCGHSLVVNGRRGPERRERQRNRDDSEDKRDKLDDRSDVLETGE